MTPRYRNRWFAAHARHGGWVGPRTIECLATIANECYIAGYTADQTGRITALEYRLYSLREDTAEEIAGLKEDARSLARGEAIQRDYLP